jgi:large subunit ribosomal protein L6
VSRIAKYPIAVPKGVEVNVASGQISVKGPLGVISRPADPNVAIDKNGDQLVCKALGNSNHADAMSGTMRALVANMVTGVTKGFERKLALVGVGYRAKCGHTARRSPTRARAFATATKSSC